ncbi:FtsK/SpoIIIE domain-containing protein [Intrasporangium sp.]|uniref:FtsK/SpoIIIE domain-containing protein n=1 Tax=Intrasporangium sp. TaxID=1925024 RepID=UPI0033654E5E
MRIRMGLVAPLAPAKQEILIDAEGSITFGEIRPKLVALLPDSCDVFIVDGHEISDADVVGEGRLLRGALLRAVPSHHRDRPPRRMPLGSGALVELHIVGGPGAGRIVQVRRGDHVLGRAASSDVRLDDLGISRAHALITVDDAGIRWRDLDPTNPSRVDDHPVAAEGSPLTTGSRISIASTTLVLRRPETTPAAAECSGGTVRINRRPRFVHPPEVETIRFPPPPTRPEGARAPVVAAAAPLVVSVGLAAVLRSPVMLLFALMSPVLLVAQWWGDRRHGRVSYRTQLAEHARETDRSEARLAEALAAESRRRHAEQPDLATAGSVAGQRDARVWERRPGDPDHLALRVGTAVQPAETRVEGPDGEDGPPTLRGVPAVLELETEVVIGIAGPRPRSLCAASALIAQTAIWHSPRTTRLVVISTSPTAGSDWGWASRLPHALGGDLGPLATVASTQDEAAVAARLTELEAVVSARTGRPPAGGPAAPPLPRFVVVLDGSAELRRRADVRSLLGAPHGIGVHVIGIDDAAERLPQECRAQLVLDDGRAPRATLQLADRTIAGITPDLPQKAWFESVSRSLAPLDDATPEDDVVSPPASIGLREANLLTGLDPTVAEELVACWSTSTGRPVAVLGAATDGAYLLDVAQDGPHCLVGGTTGSGKSELLQTLVSGLAMRAGPDELTFVLVDYKGGSAFQECARLPHTLGVVTDLDEHLTERALVSLGAELKRREALLASAGAKDLDDYRRRREADPALTPIARLVLVVDEFKLLADELPDFVEGLVRIAAVGRSLGLHLVLATQRPAGIITGDMRANISLRIALRVRDRSDSDDVIEVPDAAQISDRTPGRAWVRTGGGRLVEVQTAYAGTVPRPENSAAPSSVHVLHLTWADLGHALPALHASAPNRGRTELESVVHAAREAAQILRVTAPPSPWLPALPELLRRDDLPAAGVPGAVALGLVDRPEAPSQAAFTWHPLTDGNLAVAGGARTGRSTLLRTLAVGLAERWSAANLHLHVIEGTPGALRDLAALPHVGSVTSTADPAVAARVVSRLTEDVARAASQDAGDHPMISLANQRASNQDTAPRAGRHVILLVDGWEAVEAAFEDIDHGAPTEALLRLARDGLSSGFRIVVTGGRSAISGRLAGHVQQRLVLPMPDPLDLTLAGLSPAQAHGHRGAGRAIDVATGHHVQLAYVGPDPTSESQADTAGRIATQLNAAAADPARLPWRVAPLPRTVSWDQLPPPTLDQVSIGLGGDDASALGFRADQHGGRVVIVGGPRSGRTTALATLARQLAIAGHPTAVITTRRTPLSWLSGMEQLHLVPATDGRRLHELRATHPHLSVLVDDAEGLDGTAAEPAVLGVLRDLDGSDGWCAATVDTRRATSLYRGIVPELARHGTGLVLTPTSPTDGDLLGVRVEPVRERLPGRGVLVLDGLTVPVQVADSSPTDDALCARRAG